MDGIVTFLDTETDGVHAGRQIWECAHVRRDAEGEREDSYYVEIDLSTADKFGLNVGRFFERHPLGRWIAGLDSLFPEPDDSGNYVTRREAAHRVVRATYGTHVVGAVPDFDTEILSALLRENELIDLWHYHLIDVENLAVGWLAGRGLPLPSLPWKSRELAERCGMPPIDEEAAHTALGDVRFVQRFYDLLLG